LGSVKKELDWREKNKRCAGVFVRKLSISLLIECQIPQKNETWPGYKISFYIRGGFFYLAILTGRVRFDKIMMNPEAS